jgi:hypothetical protein
VNVCIFSVVVGQRLGLTKHQLYELGLGALFHDVGKMRIDEEIINKTDQLMDEEWDALILLDGCRYDQFEALNVLPGELESRISLGSTTKEFLRENFAGETHWDTVYVTASPMYRTVEMDDAFHDVVDVWQTDWDEERQTVTPDAVMSAALKAREAYPDKRLFVHFMQPHYPFIGETGQTIRHSGYERTRRLVETGQGSWDNPKIWSLVWSGG